MFAKSVQTVLIFSMTNYVYHRVLEALVESRDYKIFIAKSAMYKNLK